MSINKTNIKKILSITENTYNDNIDILIPILLESICNYCKNDFIAYNYNGYIYESLYMSIEDYSIELDTSIPLKIGDFIRLYGTEYNDGLYQIKNYSDSIITIDSTKILRDESINAFISLVEFPYSFNNIIAQNLKNNIVKDGNIKIESIDDVRVEYFVPYDENTFINQNKLILNNYRNVFRKTFQDLFNIGVGQ